MQLMCALTCVINHFIHTRKWYRTCVAGASVAALELMTPIVPTTVELLLVMLCCRCVLAMNVVEVVVLAVSGCSLVMTAVAFGVTSVLGDVVDETAGSGWATVSPRQLAFHDSKVTTMAPVVTAIVIGHTH